MRYVNYTLRPLTIDNAKPREKAYALTDGGGLLLEVLPSGAKTWRYKYHLNGKREKVTIGTYPAFTIKQARDRHEALYTMTRKSELLRSKWHEFDLDAAQWDIPAERMKMGKPHRVFLSRQAVELLRQVASTTAYSHIELAAERKRALQFLADRVEALATGALVTPLRAA